MKIIKVKTWREVDAIVAEKVMGWTAVSYNSVMKQFRGIIPIPLNGTGEIPHYSTSMDAAWKVRAKMESEGYESNDKLSWVGWGKRDKHPFGYSIWFQKWVDIGIRDCFHSHVGDFKNAPKAISLAALKTKGIEVEFEDE